MDAEQSSKMSHDQIDSDIEPGETFQYPPERPDTQIDTDIESDQYSQQGTDSPHESTEFETEVGGSPPEATYRIRD